MTLFDLLFSLDSSFGEKLQQGIENACKLAEGIKNAIKRFPIIRRRYSVGIAGGTCPKIPFSSSTVSAFTHSAMPAFQTKLAAAN